jgi:hypothetical protein
LRAEAKAATVARSTHRGSLAYDTAEPWDKAVAQNLGWLLVDAVLGRLEVVNVAQAARRRRGWNVDVADLLRLLVTSRVLWPGSRLRLWERRDQLFDGPKIGDRRDIYQGLDHIADLAGSLQRACSKSLGRARLGTVDCDVTKHFCAIDQNDSSLSEPAVSRDRATRQRVRSRDNRLSPIVQMGLLWDRHGLPIGYRLFDGNMRNTSLGEDKLAKLKAALGCRRVVVVADQSTRSGPNLAMLHRQGDGWIVSTSARSGRQELKHWLTDPAGWAVTLGDDGLVQSKTKSRIVNSAIPQTGHGVNSVPVLVEEKQVARWSRHAAAHDARDRAETIAKADSLAYDPAAFKAGTHQDTHRYAAAEALGHTTGATRSGREVVLNADHSGPEQASVFDGYEIVRTSETELSDHQVIKRHDRLWRIEKAFRTSMNCLDARAVYVPTRAHVEAHFTVCFLALLVTQVIERWTRIPAERLIHALRTAAAMPCGPGVFRLQRSL